MKIQDYKKLIRKSHRYLGVFIGIQFLFWTISGLYFTWTDIGEIRGEHLRAERNTIEPIEGVLSPLDINSKLQQIEPNLEVTSFRLVKVIDKNYFEVTYKDSEKKESITLFDTKSGELRKPFTKEEAESIATDALAKKAKTKETEYLTKDSVGSHSEYREKPLPAWAVSFEHPEDLTVYVSANNGQVQSFRTDSWRIFDFLWMLHTMDFAGRDNFNNWLLRIITFGSLIMILSGFLYFLITARKPW